MLRPRSYCDSCQRTLASIDMIPVLSYAWLRGKCRHCKAAMPFRVVLVEVVTGTLFLTVFLLHGMSVEWVVISACLSLLVLVSLIDLEHGLILDVMVIPSIVILLLLAPFWTEIGIPRSFLGDETLIGSYVNSLPAKVVKARITFRGHGEFRIELDRLTFLAASTRSGIVCWPRHPTGSSTLGVALRISRSSRLGPVSYFR